MRPISSSTLVARSLCLCLAIAAAHLAIAAPASEISLSAAPERPSITAGEPLFVKVTFENVSSERVSLRTDPDVFSRVTIGPQASRAVRVPPPPTGDTVDFYKGLPPGSKESILFVATETAGLRVPGDYQMSIEHVELGASCILSFTVKQYDAAAVRARAQEISEIAADSRNGADTPLNEIALTAFDPSISSDLLCSVLRRNSDGFATARRLAELGDATSIDCLLAVLPTTHGLKRELLIDVLKGMLRTMRDSNLREKIGRAVQDQ
jgi:hypothetical protein